MQGGMDINIITTTAGMCIRTDMSWFKIGYHLIGKIKDVVNDPRQ